MYNVHIQHTLYKLILNMIFTTQHYTTVLNNIQYILYCTVYMWIFWIPCVHSTVQYSTYCTVLYCVCVDILNSMCSQYCTVFTVLYMWIFWIPCVHKCQHKPNRGRLIEFHVFNMSMTPLLFTFTAALLRKPVNYAVLLAKFHYSTSVHSNIYSCRNSIVIYIYCTVH